MALTVDRPQTPEGTASSWGKEARRMIPTKLTSEHEEWVRWPGKRRTGFLPRNTSPFKIILVKKQDELIY